MTSADAKSFGASFEQLRAAQKNSTGAPLYSKLVNRPLGRVFAAAAHQFGLTPNAVTGISAAFTFAGIIVLAVAPLGVTTGLVVGVLLVLGYALDSADGQLARLRGGGSLDGEWLDHVVDSVKLATIHLAVLVAAYRSGAPQWFLWVPIAFAVAQNVYFFGMIATDLVLREHHARTAPGTPFAAPRFGQNSATLVSVVRITIDYGFLCVAFVLLGVPWLFGAIYTVMAVCMVGYTALAAIRWFRLVRSAS
ncbi:CDP-alcohol phosphatidyltransferase family protein [Micropruina sp.]|uniref:CDP-alcohol phosphatidyltransferase family protein n=1 Tax=Micropruina sp. TaxID=2737536 RepID=UPI0039E33639